MQLENNQPSIQASDKINKQPTKKGFIIGLIIGIVVAVIIIFVLITGSFLNQQDKNVVSSSQNIQIRSITADDWVRGDRNAKISIIEFSDTECPFCKNFHIILKRIVKEYNGQVNWVYRYYPIESLHPKAFKEAEATECAGEFAGNNGFWKYLDRLFIVTPSNNQLDMIELPNIAQYIGLDRNKFAACLSSNKYAAKIQDQFNQAMLAGGQGTPYSIIIVNNKKIPISGVIPYNQLKLIIDELLKL